MILNVITSYSIHYTKLYDVEISNDRLHNPRGEQTPPVWTSFYDNRDTNPCFAWAAVRLWSYCSHLVITSYSIHYTKLYEDYRGDDHAVGYDNYYFLVEVFLADLI